MVIAIIAILAALLLPALSQAREISKRILCASTCGNVWPPPMVYAADYHAQAFLHDRFDAVTTPTNFRVNPGRS